MSRPTTPTSAWAISRRCWTSARPTPATCGDSGRYRRPPRQRAGSPDEHVQRRVTTPGCRGRPATPNACAPAARQASRRVIVALRVARRISLLLLLAPALPLLAVVLPGWSKSEQIYCRLLLWCLGVRITLSGGPIRNLPGVLVVSDHMSWLDILTIGAVLPSSRWRASPRVVCRPRRRGGQPRRADDGAHRQGHPDRAGQPAAAARRGRHRRRPAVRRSHGGGVPRGHHLVWLVRAITPGLGAVLSGDVPGGRRHRPTGPAAAAALPAPGRPSLDCPGLSSATTRCCARSAG